MVKFCIDPSERRARQWSSTPELCRTCRSIARSTIPNDDFFVCCSGLVKKVSSQYNS